MNGNRGQTAPVFVFGDSYFFNVKTVVSDSSVGTE